MSVLERYLKCEMCGGEIKPNAGWIHLGHRFCSRSCTFRWDKEVEVPAEWNAWEKEEAVLSCEDLASTAKMIVRVGARFVHVKAKMQHGRFGRWIDELLPIGHSSVNQFMQIAQDSNILRYTDGANSQHVGNLPSDRLLLTEICGLPAPEFDGYVEDGVIHAEMKRGDIRRAKVAADHQTPARPTASIPPVGKYGVILADPPWKFEVRGPSGQGRAAENHYPTMTTHEIASLKVDGRTVPDLAHDDAVLFLWTTSNMIPDALAVIQAWGFTFKTTAFVWLKDGAPGLGYWTRKRSEICLLGTRGNPKRQNADVDEGIWAPRFEHSQKPKAAYERIERLVAGPYIELFARHQREGWEAWGNHPGLEEESQ